MDSFFFRVEHDLLKSQAFQELKGSAIKVYLVLGLHSDFGTGWAYPSIRTIARQAGLSRQTVLDAITELTRLGIVATSKSKGRSTAYRILKQPPARPTASQARKTSKALSTDSVTVPNFFQVDQSTVPDSLDVGAQPRPNSRLVPAEPMGRTGRSIGPEEDTTITNDNNAVSIAGTPFELTLEGELRVVADLLDVLKEQGLSLSTARRLSRQSDPETIAKVVLNALYLQSQGKLQNAPGYIRSGIEDRYDLLPQVAQRLEKQRKDHQSELDRSEARRKKIYDQAEKAAEEAAIQTALDALDSDELEGFTQQAIDTLPDALTRRNPSITNPFVRGKVYELVVGKLARDS